MANPVTSLVPRGRPWSRLIPAAAALGVALLAAACGSTTPSSSAGGTTSTTAGATSTTGGTSQADELKSLQSAVGSAKNATFKATYTSSGSGSGSGSSTVTFEQKPPKMLFRSGDGVILNNGTTTYFCSGSSGQQNCVTVSGSANPMAGLIQLYNGSTATALFQQWQSQVAAKLAGVDVSFTNQTFGGQSSKCVNWSYQGQSAKYCVTDSGILAYAGGTGTSNSGSFELTAYSTDVSDGDFSVPAGATVQSMPSSQP